LQLVQSEQFWNEALAHAGYPHGRALRVWRGRRHDNALLEIEHRRWLGRAPIVSAPAPTGSAAPALASATEAAALGRIPPGAAGLGVLAPALLAHGTVDGQPYLIRQWIDGAQSGATEDELAEVCERLRHFQAHALPRDFADQWHAGRRPGLNRRIEMVKSWASKLIDDVSTTTLVAIVCDPPDSIQLAFSHGRVAPDKLLRNEAGLWLIDFEEAAAQRAEFYDAAQCYYALRVVPRTHSPGGFAARFRKTLPRSDRRRFDDAFRWHLAGMTVAGYLDHFTGAGRVSRMNLDLLTDDVVRGRLHA
jgi:hypothetical protein